MRVSFHHSHPEAKNIITFWFQPDKQFSFIAGQFIEMTLPIKRPDKRGAKHWFTLSSSPTEKLISITTKYSQDQSSTFKQWLHNMKPGAVVDISGPMGDFVLPKDTSVPLLYVAGGIGLTPMRSMAKWLLDKGEKRDIQMLYAVSSIKETIFLDVFNKAGIRLTLVPKEPSENWKGQSGRLTGERILELCPSARDRQIYLSGPEPMVGALSRQLLDAKINSLQLVTDYFPGYESI